MTTTLHRDMPVVAFDSADDTAQARRRLAQHPEVLHVTSLMRPSATITDEYGITAGTGDTELMLAAIRFDTDYSDAFPTLYKLTPGDALDLMVVLRDNLRAEAVR